MKNVIVDIDGTISNPEKRLKYITQQRPKNWDAFYHACDTDTPISTIIELVKNISTCYNISFCTGRRQEVFQKTLDWIYKHFGDEFSFKIILMRKEGDTRPDIEVKPELLHERHFTPANVAFILEDRSSMVNKWRELGYTCLQVADGNF